MEELTTLFPDKFKESTIKVHSGNIERLYHICNCAEGDERVGKPFRIYPANIAEIHNLLSDPQYVIQNLNSDTFKLATKANYLESIKQALLAISEKYQVDQAVFDIYVTEHEQVREDLEISRALDPHSTRIDRWKLNKILELLLQDYGKSKKASKEYLLIKICATFPFRNETGTVERISLENYQMLDDETKKERNFLVTGMKMYFSFGRYKTAGNYGLRLIEVQGDLKDKLNEYCEKYRKEGEFIFFDGCRSGADYKDDATIESVQKKQMNNYTKYISRILETDKRLIEAGLNFKASPNDFAKLLEKEALEMRDSHQLKKLADQRGHQVKTAIQHYAI